jgi:Protein of unknown function (DUF2786)
MDNKILDRVRKLLELAKSDNINEASNAAAAAQELMTRHAIGEAMLDVKPDADEKAEPIQHDLLHATGGLQLPSWKGVLGTVLCEVNGCMCFRTGGNLNVIGRPSDAATVRYLFAYIAHEVDRLAELAASERGNPGRTWLNNFRLGAVTEVNRRLRQAHKDTRAAMRKEADASDTLGTGAALVRINNALAKLDAHQEAVAEYGKRRLKLRKGSRSQSRFDESARDAGREAGASIDLSRGSRPGLGSGTRRALHS